MTECFKRMSNLPRDRKLMWAYGSNLHLHQMAGRCPQAEPFCALNLARTALRFRGVADVVAHESDTCPGGLWWITADCERTLDRYEGVSARMYLKRYFTIAIRGVPEPLDVLYYKMNSRGIMPPSEHYLDIIAQGYRDFGLDLTYLERALEHAWNKKEKTKDMRARYGRRPARFARGIATDLLLEQAGDAWRE